MVNIGSTLSTRHSHHLSALFAMVGVDVSSYMVTVERLQATCAAGKPLLAKMLRSLVAPHRHLVHCLKLTLAASEDL